MKKFSFKINGNSYECEIKSVEDNVAEVEVNGAKYAVEFDRVLETTKTPKLVRQEAIPSTDITRAEHKTSSPAGPKGSGFVKSPLPGTIIGIHVKVGDTVRAGDKLITLEAMKMENVINSDKSGTVTLLHVKQGDAVMEGDLLIEIN
jgi:glutaconyl-CoA/methylmalonyl-CoA decarboxylase subunit gamma